MSLKTAINPESPSKIPFYTEQERDTRYTKASILMVVLFMFCHIPRFVANTIELIFLDQGAAHTHRVRE